MQTVFHYYRSACLYADKQILQHNCLKTCKQTDMFTCRQGDFQTGLQVCMFIDLHVKMQNGK